MEVGQFLILLIRYAMIGYFLERFTRIYEKNIKVNKPKLIVNKKEQISDIENIDKEFWG